MEEKADPQRVHPLPNSSLRKRDSFLLTEHQLQPSASCSPRNSSLFLSSTPWARARRWRSSPTNHTLSLLTFRVFFYSSVDLHSPAKSQSSHLSKKNKMIRNSYSPVISTLFSFRTGNGMKSSSSPRPKEENMASSDVQALPTPAIYLVQEFIEMSVCIMFLHS
ncbi:unnamed protein product, partial [Musa banksii]